MDHLKQQLPFVTAILLMGGTGNRFGSDLPKQFHRLAGKKIYSHTLEACLYSELFTEILLVAPQEWIHEIEKDLLSYDTKNIRITAGGATRQESSLRGLIACKTETEIVVIHDAVRPFVTKEILKKNIEGALLFQAVDTCIPSADTLVYAPAMDQVSSIPPRSDYRRGQTPQSFSYPLILNAHLQAQAQGVQNQSDDCALVLRLGHPIHIVEGSEENLKITTELDLFLAEQLLRLKTLPTTLSLSSSLKGQRIAITGGTSGIGKALCTLLEQEGAIPIILGRTAPHYPVDLTSFAKTQHIFDQILTDHGPLDALVNSAGQLKVQSLDTLSAEEIDQLIKTNLTSVIYSCKCVHLKKGGRIVNIASSSYTRGRADLTIYASAKAAVVNFTQGLAEERPELFINALIPQRTRTPMRLTHFPEEDPETLLDPQEVAQEILSLLKQQTMTGSLIEIRKK